MCCYRNQIYFEEIFIKAIFLPETLLFPQRHGHHIFLGSVCGGVFIFTIYRINLFSHVKKMNHTNVVFGSVMFLFDFDRRKDLNKSYNRTYNNRYVVNNLHTLPTYATQKY